MAGQSIQDYSTAFEIALESAPIIYLNQSGLPISGNQEDGLGKYFKNTTDHTPVDWNIGASMVSSGNQIIVPSLVGLRELQRQIVSIIGGATDEEQSNHIKHEGQHAFVAGSLGAGKIAYGINLWKIFENPRSREHRIAWQAFARIGDLRTTKLGLAAVMAYPDVPSQGDDSDVLSLGYDGGVDEVGARIVAHNIKSSSTLPVPRSYTPSTRVHIPLL